MTDYPGELCARTDSGLNSTGLSPRHLKRNSPRASEYFALAREDAAKDRIHLPSKSN